MTRYRGSGVRSEETGAVLLIVLFFVLGIGLSLAALIGVAGTNLIATGQIQAERNIEYSADTAADGAIQAVRSISPNPPTNPACPNFPSTGSLSTNQNSMVVTCSMGIIPGARFVEFAVCTAPTTGSLTFPTCLPNALLVAQVEYIDTGCTTGDTGCTDYGAGVTVDNWLVKRANN